MAKEEALLHTEKLEEAMEAMRDSLKVRKARLMYGCPEPPCRTRFLSSTAADRTSAQC